MITTETNEAPIPEPWLRGTLTDLPAVIRGVLHALELAREDVERWCGDLTGLEVNARPAGLPSIAFQIRHIAGSLDRLLTYAEAIELNDDQLAALLCEMDGGAMPHVLLREFARAIERSGDRIRAVRSDELEQERLVGRKQLPTTLGGLLVHIAEHTQRHVGQLVTTAKFVRLARQESTSPNFQ